MPRGGDGCPDARACQVLSCVNVCRRGGLHLCYRLATALNAEFTYEIPEGTPVLAEIVVDLGDKTLSSSQTRMSDYEEYLGELMRKDVVFYVALLPNLYQQGFVWAWPREFIMLAAWAQRGYIPYGHLRWEHTMGYRNLLRRVSLLHLDST